MGMDRPPRGIHYVNLFQPVRNVLANIELWCEVDHSRLINLDSYVGASGSDPMNQGAATQLRGLPVGRLLIDHQSNPVQGVHYTAKRAFGTSYKTHVACSSLQLEQVSNAPGTASEVLRQVKNNFGPRVRWGCNIPPTSAHYLVSEVRVRWF